MSTSDGSVPLNRPVVGYGEIATGSPVRALAWHDAAKLAAWVAGRGSMLVPQHRVNVRLSAGGTTTNTLRYYVAPQGHALARVWVFEIRGTPLSGPGQVKFTAGSDPQTSAWTVEPEAFGARTPPIIVVEGAGVNAELARTFTAGEISCLVTCTAGYIDIISCAVWELPRVALERDTTDLAVARDALFPRRDVLDDAYQSVGGAMDAARGMSAAYRTRGGHIGRWGPYVAVTSGTATSLHYADYKLVPAYMRDVSEPVACRVYAERSDGTTDGDFRIVTGTAGASDWFNIGLGAAAGWYGPLRVLVEAEVPGSADGQPGGTADTLRVEVRRTAGAGEVRVYGWSVYESERWWIDYTIGSFSRASEASVVTATPNTATAPFVRWIPANTLRYENRGDGAGYLALFEKASTNELLRSQELDNASWLTAGTVTVTAGQASPDSTTAAERLQAASGTNIRYQNLTPGSGWNAFSAWARATSGTVDHSIYLFDGATVTYAAQAALTTTYARLAGAFNCGAGVGNFAACDARAGGGILAGTRDAYVTLCQVENGRYTTSAIRTTSTTTTRNADTLTLTTSQYPAAALTVRGRFSEVSPIFANTDLASGDERWLLSIGGSSNGIRIYHDGTDVRVEALEGGTVRARSAALTFSKHGLLGPVAWDQAAGLVYVNGTAGAAGTPWTWSSAAIRIGGVYSGSNEADCRLGYLTSW